VSIASSLVGHARKRRWTMERRWGAEELSSTLFHLLAGAYLSFVVTYAYREPVYM
jgi:hypothetical protein